MCRNVFQMAITAQNDRIIIFSGLLSEQTLRHNNFFSADREFFQTNDYQ